MKLKVDDEGLRHTLEAMMDMQVIMMRLLCQTGLLSKQPLLKEIAVQVATATDEAYEQTMKLFARKLGTQLSSRAN